MASGKLNLLLLRAKYKVICKQTTDIYEMFQETGSAIPEVGRKMDLLRMPSVFCDIRLEDSISALIRKQFFRDIDRSDELSGKHFDL